MTGSELSGALRHHHRDDNCDRDGGQRYVAGERPEAPGADRYEGENSVGSRRRLRDHRYEAERQREEREKGQGRRLRTNLDRILQSHGDCTPQLAIRSPLRAEARTPTRDGFRLVPCSNRRRLSARAVRDDVDERPTRLANHEVPDPPLLIAERIGVSKPRSTALAWTASTSGTSTEMPGAAMSSFPMMVTWAERLVGDTTVTTQPMSIATSKPSRSRKKSRVSAGRSDLCWVPPG